MTETTETTPAVDPRIKALMKHLDCEVDDIEADSHNTFYVGRQQYAVLTDDEADEECAESIKDSLWAFNPSFLASHIPALRGSRVEKAWRKVQEELCEDANPLIEAMLGSNLDRLVQDAVAADGRGHFLAHYDGHENDESVDGVTYYIYRNN